MRLAKSRRLLKQVLAIIPSASQTYSKSYTQLPFPIFAANGRGARIKDIDGNEYVDMVMGLGAITLGYRDKDVEEAICLQMLDGITFSLPTRLESQLAGRLIEHIGGCEMVRFAKNGSDVTSAAVRLARAYTKRDHIAMCGYHGGQDWSIGVTSMHGGVPREVIGMTHRFDYNNLSQLETLFNNYALACVIMEPMNFVEPTKGFLGAVKELCRDHGALLIFDEVVTGFRFGLGGAGEFLGETPDITCLGKGLANGMPLSALCGSKQVMRFLEKDVFMSSTFGGETLSLAAALATISKMEKKPVHSKMIESGNFILTHTRRMLDKIPNTNIHISGHPTWSKIVFRDDVQRSVFITECAKRGVLTNGTHMVSYSHGPRELERLMDVYAEVFRLIAKGATCKIIQPIFQSR